MQITIVGQGAMGLLWYHQLAKDASNQLSLVCSTRILSVPLDTPFTDIDNQVTSQPLIVANRATLQNAELILVCVKSYQIAAVLRTLSKQFNAKATVIFCHNGMVDFNLFAALKQPCYTLLTTHASKIIKPFHTQHTGLGHNDLGLITGKIKLAAQEKVIAILSKALPSLTLSANIQQQQWQKLAINCVINPMTAIDNVDNGQLLNDKYATVIDKVLAEVITVARYENVEFDLSQLQKSVRKVAKQTAKNCSSMRSDILQQRKTEIDYINGYIVNLANKFGVAVPENEKLVQQVNALEN